MPLDERAEVSACEVPLLSDNNRNRWRFCRRGARTVPFRAMLSSERARSVSNDRAARRERGLVAALRFNAKKERERERERKEKKNREDETREWEGDVYTKR